MKRVIIIGSGGAGKSTLARRLGEKTGIEVIHLDMLYWKPGWVKTGKEEWCEIVRQATEKESWIMDGNFGGTFEMRAEAADTIIFLEISRLVCLYRVLKRLFFYRNTQRPDMAPMQRKGRSGVYCVDMELSEKCEGTEGDYFEPHGK